jgi:hypothetical protein
MYSGWDETTFNRSGDLVAVAVLKTLDDSEMATPESAKFVLLIIRMAFECPQSCVKVADDRRPRMTLLLLLACADRATFVQRFPQAFNAEVDTAALMKMALANPDCEGIMVNSATSEHRILILRDRIVKLIDASGKGKPWWRRLLT